MGVAVFGMAWHPKRQAAIETTREEYLWVSPALFDDVVVFQAVEDTLGDANFAVTGLTKGLQADIKKLAAGFDAEALAWSTLGERYQSFLDALTSEDPGNARAAFREDALRITEDIYHQVIRGNGTTGNAYAAGAKGHDEMKKYVSKLTRAAKEYRESEVA